jgi:hypothetical protein
MLPVPPSDVKVDRSVKNGYVQEYIRVRFNQLDGEYRTAMPPGGDPEASRMIGEVRSHARVGLLLDDIMNYEKAVLKLCPPSYLRRRAWQLRTEFRDFAGPSQYDLYLKSNPPNPDQADVDIEALRSDLLNLQNQLHYLYYLRPARERARNSIVNLLGWSVFIVSMVAVALIFKANLDIEAHEPPGGKPANSMYIAPLCAICGAVGGFLSMMRRLQRDSTGGNPLLALYALVYGRTSIFIAPITGAVFSIVLVQLFVAGIITGTVFPKMQTDHDPTYNTAVGIAASVQPVAPNASDEASARATDAGTREELTLHDFLCHTHPVSRTDYAALLIWAFLAGFAEQLVPDTLDRLAAQKKVTENTKSVDPQRA